MILVTRQVFTNKNIRRRRLAHKDPVLGHRQPKLGIISFKQRRHLFRPVVALTSPTLLRQDHLPPSRIVTFAVKQLLALGQDPDLIAGTQRHADD